MQMALNIKNHGGKKVKIEISKLQSYFEPKYQHNTKLKKYCEKQLGEKKMGQTCKGQKRIIQDRMITYQNNDIRIRYDNILE